MDKSRRPGISLQLVIGGGNDTRAWRISSGSFKVNAKRRVRVPDRISRRGDLMTRGEEGLVGGPNGSFCAAWIKAPGGNGAPCGRNNETAKQRNRGEHFSAMAALRIVHRDFTQALCTWIRRSTASFFARLRPLFFKRNAWSTIYSASSVQVISKLLPFEEADRVFTAFFI